MLLIGDGSVPLSLLVLGANLTAEGIEPLKRINGRYLLVGTVAKTIVQPAMNVGVYFLCQWLGMLPASPITRITLWVELIAPSAIMSTVLCRLEGYMAECATGLLLLQYVVAVFTTTGWLSLFLLLN
jgi:predicted permease